MMNITIDNDIVNQIHALAEQEGITTDTLLQRLLNNFRAQLLQQEKHVRSAELPPTDEELTQTRFRGLFEQSNDAIMLFTLNDQLFDYNQRALELLGYTPEEMLELTVFDVVKREAHSQSMDIGKRLLEGEKFPLYERIFLHKDGSEIPVEVNIECVFDKTGKPRYFQSISRDIRERKKMEQDIRASELRHRTVLHAMAEGVVIHDSTGAITYTNPAAEEMIGLTADQMRGLTPIDLSWRTIHEDGTEFPGETHPASVSLREGIVQTNVPMGVYKPDKQITWLSINSVPMLADDNSVTGVVVTFSDFTSLKAAQEQAVKLAVEQERIRAITNFVQAGSHEFRTPLSIIQTNTYLLGRQLETQPEALDRLAKVDGQVKRINRLVDRLLLMAKLDAMTSLEHNTTIDLSLLLTDLATTIANPVEQQTITLGVPPYKDGLTIKSRDNYLMILLREILDNAIRHSLPDSTVTLDLQHDNETVTITVVDHGISIEEDDLAHIFERFWRKDASHNVEGFGLGLAIAQRVIELHDGTITVKSTPDVGTQVMVSLPVMQVP